MDANPKVESWREFEKVKGHVCYICGRKLATSQAQIRPAWDVVHQRSSKTETIALCSDGKGCDPRE